MGVTTSAMTWIQRIAARFGQSRDTEQTEAADLIVRINEATTEDERWQIAREANLRRRFGVH
jgi:hypothetical protein